MACAFENINSDDFFAFLYLFTNRFMQFRFEVLNLISFGPGHKKWIFSDFYDLTNMQMDNLENLVISANS